METMTQGDKNCNELLVIDKTNFFKFKLTQKDRQLIKKKFGERGYRMFLGLNSMGYFSDMDVIGYEVIHQILMNFNEVNYDTRR